MAKLFLYSGGSSDENSSLEHAFVEAVGKRGRITYIPAAHPAGEAEYLAYCAEKRRLGLGKTVYFPIDRQFSEMQRADALASEAIFLSGGNTYHFLANLRRAGMISRLRTFVKQGGVLAGLSAGSLIMTPTIELAGLVPGESDENSFQLKKLAGLALVDFEVFPHFTESALSVKVLTKYSKRKPETLIYAFPDGSGIQISDSTITFHRQITCFGNGQRYELVTGAAAK